MDGVLAERARRVAEVRLAPMATRLAHVRGVAAAAERLVERIDPLEAEALVAAAWLHDVGYAPSVRSTGFHSLDGAVFVRAEGFPPLVVSLVAYHTGAVFEARAFDAVSFDAAASRGVDEFEVRKWQRKLGVEHACPCRGRHCRHECIEHL